MRVDDVIAAVVAIRDKGTVPDPESTGEAGYALVAEVERLRAENSELQSKLKRQAVLEAEGWDEVPVIDVYELHAENAGLHDLVSTRDREIVNLINDANKTAAELDWFRRLWKHARRAICSSDTFEAEEGRRQALHFVMSNPRLGAGT